MRLPQPSALKKLFPLPQHKYAIQSSLLGDASVYPWSNLGLWQSNDLYVDAACRLADHLAQSIDLNSNDVLLDLGCGQGASLLHWQQQYQVKQVIGVELQSQHVNHLQALNSTQCQVLQGSFLNLNSLSLAHPISAVICVDAAYHVPVVDFLSQVHAVLNSKGRVAFHTLVLAPEALSLTRVAWQKLALLLKAADVDLAQLFQTEQLTGLMQASGWQQVYIDDLSEHVFAGFADYIEHRAIGWGSVDALKIQMTAKLCRRLYADGLIRYVAVRAEKV